MASLLGCAKRSSFVREYARPANTWISSRLTGAWQKMRIPWRSHGTIVSMSLPHETAANAAKQPKDGPGPQGEPSTVSVRFAAMNKTEQFDVLGQLVAMGDWDGILRTLGVGEDPSKLPPNLGLLWAIARREKMNPDDPNVAAVTAVATRCAAAVLGVHETNSMAPMLAKRILRRNPVSWAKAPAPSPWISAFIMIAALIVGSGIGWIISGGQSFFFLK